MAPKIASAGSASARKRGRCEVNGFIPLSDIFEEPLAEVAHELAEAVQVADKMAPFVQCIGSGANAVGSGAPNHGFSFLFFFVVVAFLFDWRRVIPLVYEFGHVGGIVEGDFVLHSFAPAFIAKSFSK